MAFRIGEYVLRGELRNTRRNSVYGWIEFAPDYGIHIELTGNFSGALQGKHVKFTTPLAESNMPVDINALPDEIDDLADRHIGVVGEMSLKRLQVPNVPVAEFSSMSPEEQAHATSERDCLYLEWFSQNGRMVAEIISPKIEIVENSDDDDEDAADAISPEGFNPGVTEVYLDANGNPTTAAYDADEGEDDTDDDDDDPYGLFDEDLQRSVSESLTAEAGPFPDDEAGDADFEPGEPRGWDEVIPGIDPDTKAMYEQWDEIFEGKKDEPVAYLFRTPLKLPPPDKVGSDEEAEPLVKAILSQLALLSVAIDVCEHYTPLQTYYLLMSEILPTAKVHPNLAASKMVQHYSTSDYCEACDAEFEAEYDDDNQGEEE